VASACSFHFHKKTRKGSEILSTKIPVFVYFPPIGIPFLLFLALGNKSNRDGGKRSSTRGQSPDLQSGTYVCITPNIQIPIPKKETQTEQEKERKSEESKV